MSIVGRQLVDTWDLTDRTGPGNAYTFLAGSAPVAGEVLELFVSAFGTTAAPTISDDKGHVWTQRGTPVTLSTRRLAVYTAPDNGVYTAPTISADFGANTVTGCGVELNAKTGVDTATNDGVVQAVYATGTSVTPAVSMTSFGSVNNGTSFHATSAQGAVTSANNLSSPSFTSDVTGVGPSNDRFTGFQPTNNTAPQCTITSAAWLACGVEWKALATTLQNPWTPWPQLGPILAQ